ncbi:MAG: hypothetical protein ACJAR0_002787 [Candidatus Azotimanducaceae bacterium]|jgi:hypothetical protein
MHGLTTVSVIDDRPAGREGAIELLKDLDISPLNMDQPLGEFDDCINFLVAKSDAVICDFKLGERAYANFNGDKVAKGLYQRRIPTLLCTEFHNSQNPHFVTVRQYIPSIINPSQLDEETFIGAVEMVRKELAGDFRNERKAYRTFVLVEEVEADNTIIYVRVPGWNPHEMVPIRMKSLPLEVVGWIREGRHRFTTRVNLGCGEQSDLYFMEEHWRTR